MIYSTYQWENLFSDIILERGFEYYCSDQVGEITRSAEVLSAPVFGAQMYSVKIRLQDEAPVKMACSCPYAADGFNCKHMAAVLYQWEDERAQAAEAGEIDAAEDAGVGETGMAQASGFSSGAGASSAAGAGAADRDPAAMVSNADESLVRDFLTQVLREDERYFSRFRLLTGAGISAEEKRRYRKRIDRIVKNHIGRDGFISYDLADSFEIDMESFLDDEVTAMIDNGYLEDAFDLIQYLFRMLPELEIDDSDGELMMLADSCVEHWDRIAESADASLQEKLFDRCVDMLEEGDLDFLEDYVEAFLSEAFHTPRLLKRKLEYTAQMCVLLAGTQQPGVSCYSAEVWIRRHLQLLEETGASEEEIDGFCRTYLQTETVRQYMADRYLRRGDDAAAEEVLRGSLEMFGPKVHAQRPYDLQLLELYQRSGQEGKYIALLKNMVLSDRAGDMELYGMLKARYTPEEWMKILTELLGAPAWGIYRERIYEQEGMKEKLLEIVRSSGSLYTAKKYTDALKTVYPEELLDVYERSLQKAAVHAAGRSAYQEWAWTLQQMKGIPGGEERVRRILRDWRVWYSNRPAMMEELRWV